MIFLLDKKIKNLFNMNKAYKIILSILIITCSVLCMPFSYHIKANQTLSPPFLGVNVYYIERNTAYRIDSFDASSLKFSCSSSTSNYCTIYSGSTGSTISVDYTAISNTIFKYEFILDNNYVGNFSISYTNPSGTIVNETIYVNGNKAEFSILQGSSPYVTITNYNLQLNNRYDWQFPIESFSIASYLLDTLPDRYTGIDQYNNYMFPIFNIKQNDIVYKCTVSNNENWNQKFIFFINDSCNSISNFSNYFNINIGQVIGYKMLNRYYYDGRLGYLCQVDIGNFPSANQVLNITYINSNDRYFMPIYCNSKVFNEYASTDFALTFGFENSYLNTLNSINSNISQLVSTNDNIMYNFPIESYTFINSLYRRDYIIDDYTTNFNYKYPIFNLKRNQYLVYNYYLGAPSTGNNEIDLIFGTTEYINNLTAFQNFFRISNIDNVSIKFDQLYFTYNNNYNYIIKLTFTNNNTSGKSITIQSLVDTKVMPIYLNYSSKKNLSSDFALTYNLSNRLLDDIDYIAHGSIPSNNSVNNAISTNNTAQSTFVQEEQLINNQELAMQQNLDNLDISNKNNNLFGNSKFIASAQWVKTQFDWFTNNNAFGYLITFSLVIGIALVIIGKLRS